MGEAKRRRDAGLMPDGIKISPRKRAAGFLLVHHKRVEEQAADGIVYAVNVFAVQTPDGQAMVETTPDGPKPVLIASVPQPVRKSVLTVVTS